MLYLKSIAVGLATMIIGTPLLWYGYARIFTPWMLQAKGVARTGNGLALRMVPVALFVLGCGLAYRAFR